VSRTRTLSFSKKSLWFSGAAVSASSSEGQDSFGSGYPSSEMGYFS
jgi:hypothetical protein